MKFINQVGFEVEGGWEELPALPMKGDGSVRVESKHIGEIASPPFSDLDTMLESLANNYPSTHNQSCGFHIHTSFKQIGHVACLMQNDFFDYFNQEIEKWANKTNCQNTLFWERFRGNNNFCKKRFIPNEQIESDGDRYTQLNFAAFRRHKTIECRLFPMFKTIKMAQSATKTLINIYESWLEQNLEKETKIIEINENIEVIEY